jgi:hypothetical protein
MNSDDALQHGGAIGAAEKRHQACQYSGGRRKPRVVVIFFISAW